MNKLFIDTGYIIALLNRNDGHHAEAWKLSQRYNGYPTVTTDAVLLEIGNALSRKNRAAAVEAIESIRSSDETDLVHLSSTLFDKGLHLYQTYGDKHWGLVDCISFVVMEEMRITETLGFDQHFVQAGFRLAVP